MRLLRLMRRRTLIAAALTLPLLVVSIADIRFPNRNFVLLLLTLPIYLYAGWPFLVGLVRAILHRNGTNMDTFVGLVATAALLLSVSSTFFPRAFASAGAAHAYYAVVGYLTTLRFGELLDRRLRSKGTTVSGLYRPRTTSVTSALASARQLRELSVGEPVGAAPAKG